MLRTIKRANIGENEMIMRQTIGSNNKQVLLFKKRFEISRVDNAAYIRQV